VPGSEIGGNRSAEGLPIGKNSLRVEMFRANEVLVSCLGIEIKSSFTRFALTVTVSPVFQRKHVGRCVMKKLIR